MISAGTWSVTCTAQQSLQKRSRIGKVLSAANCSGFRNAPASPTSPKSITSPSRLLSHIRQTGSPELGISMGIVSRILRYRSDPPGVPARAPPCCG
jgi:hypothetical protein